ncbi:MAG: galactokinase [Acidobacteria bacterium]|nr:galactokinase [Acidobacteriota bacterium]
MIITRSPLRISLGGGGTDLPSYYTEHEGFLLAAAIDRYVYITVHEPFDDQIILKYSRLERVAKRTELDHPIVREALGLLGIEDHIEIASMADIPAGTGLGSSGSFTTALLRALHMIRKQYITPQALAEMACHIEINLLGEPIGKQDQYIAAIGGVTQFHFHRNGSVTVAPLAADAETMANLEDNLCLFFTGVTRAAGSILKDQNERSRQQDPAMLDNLHYTKDLGWRSKEALERGDLRAFAALMHEHWERKRSRSTGMSNSQIDSWYELALAHGALGGKLIGAGGGGFLMFYTEDKQRLRHAMRGAGLREVRFRFDYQGTSVVTNA